MIDKNAAMKGLRWYAGQALAGIMANPECWKQIAADYESGKKTYDECSAANAKKAWSLARFMLAEEQRVHGEIGL